MTAPAPAARAAVVFRVAARALAADAAEVAAVARRPALTRVPQAPAALAGLGTLNGRATPVIDLAPLLGDGGGGGKGGAQVLVLRGDDPVGVAVDFVEGIREADQVSADWLDLRRVIAPVFQREARRDRPAVQAVTGDEPRTGRDERELSFLEFALGGQRFAFPIAQVLAVMRVPGELVAVPGADPVVSGLMPYGEGVLAVVELADLLALPRPAPSAAVRLFVVEIGGAAVGLRVERALGTLRLRSSLVSPAPAVLNRGAGEARVDAIARTAAGLTAILAAERLFDDATMRRLGELAGAAPEPARAAAAAGEAETLVVFRLGEERYGLPAGAVEAVGRPASDLAAPPNAPPFLAGMMSHRGEATPLVDQRLRFGTARAVAARAVIFVRSGGIAAGLLVDAVERVARLPRAELERAPPLAADAGALFARVCAVELEGRPLLIADPDSLLGQARRDLSAWAAANPSAPRA